MNRGISICEIVLRCPIKGSDTSNDGNSDANFYLRLQKENSSGKWIELFRTEIQLEWENEMKVQVQPQAPLEEAAVFIIDLLQVVLYTR